MNRPLDAREATIFAGTAGWPMAAAALGITIVVLLASYWHTLDSLVSAWAHDGTYQYAFLIFPLSLWVAFTLRREVQANAPAPSVSGLVVVGLLVVLWYIGCLLDVNLAQHFAFVALFPASVLACWGWRTAGVLAFPLGYLVLFAVPWGDGLVGPLQDVTANFAIHALDLTGMPSLLNGREIITPSATWMVEDACSGVKFFAACTALGSLYAYLIYRRWWKRVIFVALAAVVPVIANGLRVYFTVLIGETWGMHYATGTDHLVFGWQFFGTVLVLLLLSGWFFRDRIVEGEMLPRTGKQPTGLRSMIWPALIPVLVAGPVAAAVLVRPVKYEPLHIKAPLVAGWNGPQAVADEWRPAFEGAAGQVQASYRPATGGAVVELFHAIYMGRPRSGHSLLTYGNHLYDQKRARVLSQAHLDVDLGEGRRTSSGELRLAGTTGSRLVWYWYCVDQQCTRSVVHTELLQVWDVLRGRAPRSSVWALSTTLDSGDASIGRSRMRAFAGGLSMGPADSGASGAAHVAGNQP